MEEGKRNIIPPLRIVFPTTLPATFDTALTDFGTTARFITRGKGWIWTGSAWTIITGVLALDEAETLAILMRTITLRFGMSVLLAIRADPENGTIAKVVRACLTPGAIGVHEVWCGVNVTEVGAELAVRNEKGYIVVVTQKVFDTLIDVGLGESID